MSDEVVVRLEGTDVEGVGLLVIDNPPMNTLSRAVQQQLRGLLDEVASREDLRVLVVAGGSERAFSAGADISELGALAEPGEAERISGALHDTFAMLEQIPQVTIAAVDGFALGGGTELALACTLRVVGPTAKMGLPEVGLGLIPGAGGTQRMPAVVGKARALQLVLDGTRLSAAEAVELGLAHRLADDGGARAEALAWAAELAARPRVALWAAKRAVLAAGGPEGYSVELAEFGRAARSADMVEGVSAFLERREPRFSHR